MYDDDARLSIIQEIVNKAEESIDHDRELDQGKVPPYGEAAVERLRAILQTGRFNEGYDPEVQYWATLWEEVKSPHKKD
ncbi:hypothetical protein SAMN05880590_107155 [Rhizobium sp. RU35A]|nr:hypothetical protein SAMN05880590_107155 [Rhizobium sp. RU35A]